MRTLGRDSLSSVLKTVLDVAYVTAFLIAGVLVLAALAILLFQLDIGHVRGLTVKDGGGAPLDLGRPEVLIAVFCTFELYLAGILVILNRLRAVFATLTAGDPFHPENVTRLRLIGHLLVWSELLKLPIFGLFMALAPEHDRAISGISLSGWFSILVVFVLAEVFREGARLRREAELTI